MRVAAIVSFGVALLLFVSAAHSTIFLPVLGWEKDVDLVVAPDGEFLVIPEESEDGLSGRITIVDLDPITGEPLGTTHMEPGLPGFEKGVDPIIVPEFAEGVGYPVLIPVESEDGLEGGVLVLLLDDSGFLMDRIPIVTSDLSFREDVDGTWTRYMDPAIAFFPLESEEGDVRGVLAIDVDPQAGHGAPGVGACTLLSTDGRAACANNIGVDFLPGLVDGVDPVSYEVAGCCSRLALPVASPAGYDLLLIDFDPNGDDFPLFMTHWSVKGLNAAGPRPTDFPGFERDVDLRLFEGECGLGAEASILVPVEGPDDVADLYLLDENGYTHPPAGPPTGWVLSMDGASAGVSFPGFEIGVDLVPMCGLGGEHPHRLALPIENALGTDADLWFVDLVTGLLLARAEDPAINPDLTIEGWEIGVDLVRWMAGDLVAPVEGLDGSGRLLNFSPDAVLQDSYNFSDLGGKWGFRPSVDPVVQPVPDPFLGTLFVPAERVDAPTEDAVIMAFDTPPALVGVSLEVLNPGLELGGFEWDVDLGLTNKEEPGGAWVYLPEKAATGGVARLRFETVPGPGDDRLVVATRAGDLPASLHFFEVLDGELIVTFDDVLGLDTGLDMANGRGSMTPGNPPELGVSPGFDADTDPSPTCFVSSADDPSIGGRPGEEEVPGEILGKLRHANPFSPPVEIRFTLFERTSVQVDVVDATGRRVRRLLEGHRVAGDHTITWDGRNDRGREVGSGVYFTVIRTARGSQVSKMLVVR